MSFKIATLAADLLTALRPSADMRRGAPSPPPMNTRIRLRQGAAVYVCHLLEADKRGWKVSVPVLDSDVVPLRPPESFLAEYTTSRGVETFFTRVVRRDVRGFPRLFLSPPSSVKIQERRGGGRAVFQPGLPAFLGDGETAEVYNLGPRGALVKTRRMLKPGCAAQLRISGTAAPLDGIVLACQEAARTRWPAFLVRLVFERDVPLLIGRP